MKNNWFQKQTKATDLSVWMEWKSIFTWGSMLPASILVFLTVNKRAGLQLAAHYRGAVVTHGRVPCSALWFRVTVDARDWREREREQSSSESDGRSRCLSRSQIKTRGSSQEGRRVGVSESGGIGKRSWLSEQLWQKQQRLNRISDTSGRFLVLFETWIEKQNLDFSQTTQENTGEWMEWQIQHQQLLWLQYNIKKVEIIIQS